MAAASVAGRPEPLQVSARRPDRPTPALPGPSPSPRRPHRGPSTIWSPSTNDQDLHRTPPPGPRGDPRGLASRGGRAWPARRRRADRRPRDRRVGPGPPPRRHPRPARLPRAAHRGRRARPRRAGRPLLRRRHPLAVRAPRRCRRWATPTSPSMRAASSRGSAEGLPWTQPVVLTAEQKQRYSRHLLIPEVGAEGQAKLLDSKVLLIGAGGLGSPAALYLAAAGVGTIGIVDFDVVDLSNLQRQVVHTTDRRRRARRPSRRAKTIKALNPDVKVVAHEEMLDRRQRRADHRGLRRHPRRHRHLRDALHRSTTPPSARASRSSTPSVFRFEGQLTVFVPVRGPVLPLPLPDAAAARAGARLLGRRRPGRRARHHGPAPGDRGAQAAARHRRAARRPAADLRRPGRPVQRAGAASRPALPGLRRRGRRRARPARRCRRRPATAVHPRRR